MVCNPTSCADRKRFSCFGRVRSPYKRQRNGFTLVEYMIATSIGLLVLAGALLLWAFATRTCASLLGYVELSSTSKNALDRMSQQIRNADDVRSCSANQLVLISPASSGTGTITNTFAYQSDAQTLVWSNGPSVQTLLTDCTNFQFNIYIGTPIPNSFTLNTNAWATNTAKVVQMEWTCIRKVTGDKKSVESQVSAKVVIRNKRM
jgi:prepilin-type N-terminal cleavage/methylation domain-containing protein